MPFGYSAENHDWDLTLSASGNLLMQGQAANNNSQLQFSCLTGAMLLSFSAIESYMNSAAFVMSRDHKLKKFSYSGYKKLIRFWDKLELICKSLDIEVDKSKGTFQVIEQMRGWRNSLVHSSPYSLEITEITERRESRNLHKSYEHREYTRSVSVDNANKFNETAINLVDLIKKASGLEPHSTCSYKVL